MEDPCVDPDLDSDGFSVAGMDHSGIGSRRTGSGDAERAVVVVFPADHGVFLDFVHAKGRRGSGDRDRELRTVQRARGIHDPVDVRVFDQ